MQLLFGAVDKQRDEARHGCCSDPASSASDYASRDEGGEAKPNIEQVRVRVGIILIDEKSKNIRKFRNSDTVL